MSAYEYHVVPAPRRGEKARGVKTTEERFALALTQLMNKLGREGWEYQRADTLPVDERVGLTGTKTTYQNMLVFRRVLAAQNCESIATMDRMGDRIGDRFGDRVLIARPDTTRPDAMQPEDLAASLAPALGAAVKPADVKAPSAAPALGPAKPELVSD
ncbi:DUF4177 domain-containing protein [Rhodobacter sp. KR11]|uniref:DUF4177 domain-containing protein n=1 Tax=Rhodobacter sp. KR11 TaxID=2974588 RepID=UPI0022223C6C|nr:DUF4177 domain-containing protein [Rhodobacter sp. KR11]MCW1920252.1 DUF4177 domain-containing protein [Rhodobacter sp. KR11]